LYTYNKKIAEWTWWLDMAHPASENMAQNGDAQHAAAAELERELSSAEAYDDGFTPRSCPKGGRLLRQPASPTLPAGMTVMQGAVDPALALEAYEYTAALGQPWGTYLTSNGESAPGELELRRIGAEPEVESLAARLLASFWRRGAAELCGADLEHVHGFSVWAVVGDVGFKTAYHLDYAEVFRHPNPNPNPNPRPNPSPTQPEL
jgi:hypothetical protein